MSMPDFPAAAARLQSDILQHIPLARAMDLAITRYTGTELDMTAPLAPNINDKGCAFGGSMASLLTLAGWGLIELFLRGEQLDCDLYVADSQLRYSEPVWGELRGVARLAEADALQDLATRVRERGKGHADVVCEIAGDGRPAATLTARFFAKRRA
ncbi:MAG TPA: YiiD C-terminal domain-containing protein [Rhodanobacteraceae bacterium]|jgi:thioesterase domain-containing protein|nr:YiiD C-terminal domain-containing protein [Rhodanobacteraceae bacterium]